MNERNCNFLFCLLGMTSGKTYVRAENSESDSDDEYVERDNTRGKTCSFIYNPNLGMKPIVYK